jgi:hypothetical protein
MSDSFVGCLNGCSVPWTRLQFSATVASIVFKFCGAITGNIPPNFVILTLGIIHTHSKAGQSVAQ